MKQLFIFTRTFYLDYSLLVAPSEDFCPEEIRRYFRNQVRGLINVDQYNPDLSIPRWLFSRYQGYTLWGVGCWNKMLSPECCKDEVHRSDLRCFTGVIISDEDIAELPYDISYFAAEFEKTIKPIFMRQRTDIRVLEGVQPNSIEVAKRIEKKVFAGLNTVAGTSVLQEGENMENLFGSALVVKQDVSIASNLLDIDLAFDKRYKFMNVSVIGQKGGQVHHFMNDGSSENDSFDSTETTLDTDLRKDWDGCGKKTYRLMFAIGATIIAILMIAAIIKSINR